VSLEDFAFQACLIDHSDISPLLESTSFQNIPNCRSDIWINACAARFAAIQSHGFR
jgi:hypothetical protein